MDENESEWLSEKNCRVIVVVFLLLNFCIHAVQIGFRKIVGSLFNLYQEKVEDRQIIVFFQDYNLHKNVSVWVEMIEKR